MPERGRDTSSGSAKARGRSRSRVRRVRDGEEKPIGSRLKKMFSGKSRNSRKSAGDTGSVDSASVAVSTATDVQSDIPAQQPDKIETPPKPEVTAEEPPSLQLVVLLMEPSTRRFELLQLEFDSMRARVVDILAQIPVSVTEEAIRKQEYEGVISETAKLMDPTTRLVDFCKEKQVLAALPTGLAVKECVRLARPILSDSQVLKMLNNGGFDVSKWKKKDTAVTTETPVDETMVKELNSRGMPSSSSSIELTKEVKNNGFSAFPLIAVLAIVAIILQATHNFVASPIQVGVPLPPGAQRSKCGLLGYLPPVVPTGCTNSYLEVNTDGTVSIFDEDRELNMLLVGGVCKKEECIDGLLMEADGGVSVGDKRVKSILVYVSDATLTPWPFEESPKLKVKQYKLNK